ncbi:hypothetical protein CGCVW01_v000731 [Colletotrichum viniferum]|nr:hypothetical protein CGCVW01_v000731 [Colletotrichum viniferum]
MAGETWEIVKMQPPYDAKEVKLTTPKHGDHVTSHNWIPFDDKVGALSVHGLYGCTSVVVLSQRGAWASHIWEKAFISHIENEFTLRAIRDIHSGVGSTNKLTEYREWGIDDLKDKPDAGNRGIIFGDGTPADSNLPIQVFTSHHANVLRSLRRMKPA